MQVKRPTIAAVIPALDEEAAIGATLSRMPRSLFPVVVVADNGSRDRTAEVAAAHGATVVREPERGYGAACLAALAKLRPEADIVVFLQADASEEPAEAERLVAPIIDGRADLVIGSRVLGHADEGALTGPQRFGNRVASALIQWLYGFRYTDLGPFRAITRDGLDRIGMRERGYGWTVEMQVRALEEGLRVMEVPVTSRRRKAGESKVTGNLAASLTAGTRILWTIVRLRLLSAGGTSST
jgi:glycosyltransferase involved in cell wall biosynthesis